MYSVLQIFSVKKCNCLFCKFYTELSVRDTMGRARQRRGTRNQVLTTRGRTVTRPGSYEHKK